MPGFEAKLWLAADSRSVAGTAEGDRSNNMDAATYKHVVLGLIFLNYVSDTVEAQRTKLMERENAGANPEDPDEYKAENVFWIHREARWSHLQATADSRRSRRFSTSRRLAPRRRPVALGRAGQGLCLR